MKTMATVLRYKSRLCMTSSRLVMPVVTLVIFIFTIYSTMPMQIVDSFTLSSVGGFFIMVWIGMVYPNIEDDVSEQVVVLRVRSDTLGYICDTLLLFILGVMLSAFMVAFPLLQNAISGNGLFTRDIQLVDVLYSAVLHIAGCYAGGATGSLLHKRMIKDRKLAVVGTLLIAVIGIVKGGIIQELGFMKYLLWVFPPLYEVCAVLANTEYYSVNMVLTGCMYFLLYGTAMHIIKLALLKKLKF